MKLYRHGDLLIKKIDKLPREAKRIDTNILAEGEFTGHKHELITLDNKPECLYSDSVNTYISIDYDCKVKHQEHEEIKIDIGTYIIIHERDYDPFEEKIRRVAD